MLTTVIRGLAYPAVQLVKLEIHAYTRYEDHLERKLDQLYWKGSPEKKLRRISKKARAIEEWIENARHVIYIYDSTK